MGGKQGGETVVAEMVVLTDRDVQGPFGVEIEIPKAETTGSVRVREPAVKERDEGLAARSDDFHRPDLLRAGSLLAAKGRRKGSNGADRHG